MKDILPLIQLDKVYGGGRDDVVPLDDYIFDFILGKYSECKTITQLLFDTDSGFLQSLEWKNLNHNILFDYEFIQDEESNPGIDAKGSYDDDERQYHVVILAQMTSDEDRIKYLLDNAQTNSQ